MLEKRFEAVSPQPFTANGTADGKVTIADTRLFKVGQKVFLKSNSLPFLDGLEVKRILSPTELLVGPEKKPNHVYSNLSGFLVADNAVIGSNEQPRTSVPMEEHSRAVYEEEPTVAIRSMLVDKYGNDYRIENPFPVNVVEDPVSRKNWDKIIILRDEDKDIVKATFKRGSTIVKVYDLTYDADKDLIQVDKSE